MERDEERVDQGGAGDQTDDGARDLAFAAAQREADRTQAPAEPEKDWKTVGKTFRATDALGGEGPSYVRPVDDGRPRH